MLTITLSNMAGATYGGETPYPFRATEFTHVLGKDS